MPTHVYTTYVSNLWYAAHGRAWDADFFRPEPVAVHSDEAAFTQHFGAPAWLPVCVGQYHHPQGSLQRASAHTFLGCGEFHHGLVCFDGVR